MNIEMGDYRKYVNSKCYKLVLLIISFRQQYLLTNTELRGHLYMIQNQNMNPIMAIQEIQ